MTLFFIVLLVLAAAVLWLPQRTLVEKVRRKRVIRILAWAAILSLLVAKIADPAAGTGAPDPLANDDQARFGQPLPR